MVNRFVVVGAGPAGLSLALQLARAGYSVALVEASRQFSRQFRGDALMPCGLEALARMGLWPLLEALPHRPLEGWSVCCSGSGGSSGWNGATGYSRSMCAWGRSRRSGGGAAAGVALDCMSANGSSSPIPGRYATTSVSSSSGS